VPLDLDPLLRRCRGNEEFAHKVLAKFRQQSAELLESLVRSAGEKNAGDSTHHAHSLKGMAATVAAEPLRQAAADAEAQSRGGDWESLTLQVQTIRRELDACHAYIASRFDTAATPPLPPTSGSPS
jgi:HPt (histidine-containing phosphotransfer) domain-containing protein